MPYRALFSCWPGNCSLFCVLSAPFKIDRKFVAVMAVAWTGIFGLGLQQASAQVPVIIDQDMSSDHDDVGDLAVLNALMNLGECNILACVSDSQNSGTPLCMSAINTYYGHPKIPCGISPNAQGSGGYAGQIAAQWPHPLYPTSAQCPQAVTLYRQVLAAQADHSVVIVSTGFFTALAGLLQSGADSISPLTGSQLVAQKVKFLSCAAGIFPVGGEFNLDDSGDDSSCAVLNNWPAPILYTGFDLGESVLPEGQLQQAPLNSPVRAAWYLTTGAGKSWAYPCWGQIADYNAVRAVEAATLWGKNTIGFNSVARVSATQSGPDTWNFKGAPGQFHQAYILETERYPATESINTLVMQSPPGAPSVPGQPSNLRATITNANTIQLQWTNNAYNETGFEIDRGINGVYTKVGDAKAHVTTYAASGLSSTANISYRVLAYNSVGESPYTYIWVYSGWTETNFQSASYPYPTYPLYVYYQTCDLDAYIGTGNNHAALAAAGTVSSTAAAPTVCNHVAVCNDSTHGQDVTISVDAASYGTEGSSYIYFFYQDASNWYRLNVSSSASKFEKSIGGTVTQIGKSGAGFSLNQILQRWKVVVSHAGTLQFVTYGNVLDYTAVATTVLDVSDTLNFATGKIGLGGFAGSGIWQNFHFELTGGSLAGTAPTTPKDLTASPANTTDPTGTGLSEVSLHWTPNPGATGYDIYQSTNPGEEKATPIGVNFNGTTYVAPYVKYGTTYHYRVVALNSFGASEKSDEAVATPTASGELGVFSNSSFELPVVSGFTSTPEGSSWTFVNSAGIEHNGSAYGAVDAPDGNQAAFLQGNAGKLGTMSQGINLTAGSYTIRFQGAQRSGQSQPFLVSVDGKTVGTYTPTSDHFSLLTTASFTVTSGYHTVTFSASDSTADKSSFIDQVSLHAEPSR